MHSFVTLTKEQALKDAGEIQKKIDAGELDPGPLAWRTGGIERQPLYQRSSDNLQFQDII